MEVWRDRKFAEKMARRVSGPSATPQRNPGYDRSIGNRRDDLESRITQPLVGVSNCHLAESPVRHFFRRIHDAAAGMGGAAAKIQAINRCVVVAPAWNRAHGSERWSAMLPWKMFPPVSPKILSRSTGESTCRWRIESGTLGAKRAISAMQRSANSSLMSSQLPSASV